MATERTGQTTDYAGQNTEFSVDDKDTDSPGLKGSEHTPDWLKWNGYYRKIPELRAAVNKLASWTFGRGMIVDEEAKKKLKIIVGHGKDTPREVLKNQWRAALICGDSFAEIIRNGKKEMSNLKPLNPGTIKIVFNKNGIIKEYQQIIESKKVATWKIKDIYHLSHQRLADSKHGLPFAEALEDLIKSRNEALEDLRILYHRNIRPINWIEVETDDTTKLNSIEETINEAYKNTENIVIPTGVIKEIKKQQTGTYSTLDSLPYLKFVVRQFVTACGMPEIILGWGDETTESASKIIYLAFQQTIEDMQRYNEEQIEIQLEIKIKLEFPASLETELMKDEKKDGVVNIQDNATKANMAGSK